MINEFAIYSSGLFVPVAIFALIGTNAQARSAKKRLLTDENPVVVRAGRLWLPARWTASRGKKLKLKRAEETLRKDATSWARYEFLCRELFAWNALETSVALAVPASVISLVVTIVSVTAVKPA